MTAANSKWGWRRASVPALAVLALLTPPQDSLAQGKISEGRGKAQQCATCHGLDGLARQPNVPHIAAEDANYLREQLNAFRSGKRQDPQMSVIAKQLSDDDIADLAAYYAAIKIQVISVPR